MEGPTDCHNALANKFREGNTNDYVQQPLISNKTYDVILKRVRETIVAVEKQLSVTHIVCVCSLTSPARNAPPYCHLGSLWLHHINRHYLINRTIFGQKKKLLNIKCFF